MRLRREIEDNRVPRQVLWAEMFEGKLRWVADPRKATHFSLEFVNGVQSVVGVPRVTVISDEEYEIEYPPPAFSVHYTHVGQVPHFVHQDKDAVVATVEAILDAGIGDDMRLVIAKRKP